MGISRKYLCSIFEYFPETGFLYRRATGKRAGSVDTKGYRILSIRGKSYRAHRVIWALYYNQKPPKQIDHKNGVTDDNSIDNLRDATASQNGSNQKTPSNNTSGVKGVYWVEDGSKWQVRVRYLGKGYFGGHFKTVAEAEVAVKALRAKLHGEFAKD